MNRVYSDEIKSFDLHTKNKDPNHIFDIQEDLKNIFRKQSLFYRVASLQRTPLYLYSSFFKENINLKD